jgi:hypothetical protein
VAAGADAAEALETPGRAHLLLGRVPLAMGPRLRGSLPLLIRGGAAAPDLVLPLDPAASLVNYLDGMSVARGLPRRARNRALAAVGRFPVPIRPLVPSDRLATLVPEHGTGSRPPAILSCAASLGVAGDSWVLSLGRGDELQRAVFHVFDGQEPAFVVKFSRVPGYDLPFLRDEAGLGLARAAGGFVAARAPRHLGLLAVGGLTASAETAAAGRQLLHLLPRHPLRLLEDIAGWIAAVGRQTARPTRALDAERERLRNLVTAKGRELGLTADVVDRLPPVPGVLQHNDLGSWNIVSDGHSFTVVDWESARESGLPLWDLFYFAGDVLPRLDGPADVGTLVRRTLEVFAGGSAHSALLFGWLRSAADQLGVPLSALGRLAALCWLHHGQSAGQREADLEGAAPAPLGHLALLAAAWLHHPGLGLEWPSLAR